MPQSCPPRHRAPGLARLETAGTEGTERQGEAEPGAQGEVAELSIQDKRLPPAEPPELTGTARGLAGSSPGLTPETL